MKNRLEPTPSDQSLKEQIAELFEAETRNEGQKMVNKFPALTSAAAQRLIAETGKKLGGEGVALCEELNKRLQLCNEIGVDAAFKRSRFESAMKFIALLMRMRQWDEGTLQELLLSTGGIRQEVMDVLQDMKHERSQRLRLLLVDAETRGLKQAVANMLEWEKQKAERDAAENAELLHAFLAADAGSDEERQIIREHPYLLSPLLDNTWRDLPHELRKLNSPESRAREKSLKAKWKLLQSLSGK
jgi:hypothetical protein